MSYTYDIRPSDAGWNLHLFENGVGAGRVDFRATDYEDAHTDTMKVAFQRAEAEAKLWLRGRQVYGKHRLRLVVHPVAAVLLGLVVVISALSIMKFAF